ncbi:MAG: PRC-barrel domain-containing protein [Methanolobus sp.]|uniref:PRC-barrel domain-containing protein n=1 Tax=Methanolobus sp. TaxID=1874737 RepID=UPI0027304C0B|nr:PRC-barrel domain-containing protein [Methanolobus sp.]MDP2217074.1 PRC-barrel domain-containing protein [Methanolobus sp.]
MSTNNMRIIMPADRMINKKVINPKGEDLGKVKEIMIDMRYGRVAYAVLTFSGLFGIAEKLFAVPWKSLVLRGEDDTFVLNVEKSILEDSVGFDRANWPLATERRWLCDLYEEYKCEPYWTD